MKTENELEQDIMEVTLKIQKDYPELSDYLSETPMKFSDGDVGKESLLEYRSSLRELLRRFAKTH